MISWLFEKMKQPKPHHPRRWGDMPTGGPKHQFRQALMLKLLQTALPQGRILDAGAGDGTLTRKLAALGYSVLALDASVDCLALLARTLEAFPYRERVELKQGTLPNSGLADAAFDGIVAGEVIEHFQDDQALVQEFHRLLKPAGVCVVSVPAESKKWDLNDDWAGHCRLYNADELKQLFETSGFQAQIIHYWGWPLGYLFHRLFYLPWLRRHHHLESEARASSVSTRIGVHPWVSPGLAQVFRLDNLFNRLPFGLGLGGGFRKK